MRIDGRPLTADSPDGFTLAGVWGNILVGATKLTTEVLTRTASSAQASAYGRTV